MLKLHKKEEDGCLTVVLAGEMDTVTSVRAERESRFFCNLSRNQTYTECP